MPPLGRSLERSSFTNRLRYDRLARFHMSRSLVRCGWWSEVAQSRYAEVGEFANLAPLRHVRGRPLVTDKRVWALILAGPPDPSGWSRKAMVPPPVGPSSATQYDRPAWSETGRMVATFHAPASTPLISPVDSRVRGWPRWLEYTPTRTLSAVLPSSR